MTARDLAREHRLLTDAARGHAAFVTQAEQRLEAGDETFGDSWQWIGIHKHLTELLEEAADLGAWAALADQALDHEPTVTGTHRDQLRAVLAICALHGAAAHRSLTQALQTIEPRSRR